jgi:galactoside O-acetyltransferase
MYTGSIGDGSVIGAGSTVVKPIPPYSVAVGTPAKVIKERPPHSKCPLCDTEQTILSEVSCYD